MVPLVVLGVALVMIAVELRAPGRRWPKVAGWWARAILLNLVQVGVAYLAAVLWDPWLHARRPWSADALGVAGGAVVGYLAITFVYYWWHRARHDVAWLWRSLHQLHHSPQRIEIATSFYKHPLEILTNGVLSSAIAYFVVGLSPEATTYAVLLTGLAELFYHWNVPTPWWLGFLVQRPESHCVHHQTGLHAYTYGDLPIYDMLFGTFRNPREWNETCGFGEKEHEVRRMLAGLDVHAPSRSGEP
jgi:sterol desaturase/sphingolipid hydroxylase (fatty acid hydroxylase superfamily)